MPPGPRRQRTKPSLTLQQKKLVGLLRSAILTVVLPCITLWLIVRAYYFELFLAVVAANAVVRLGKIVVRYAAKRIERHDQAVLVRTARKQQAMIHYVEPSTFTKRHSHLQGEELHKKTYLDDPQHWIVAIRLFFDPFAERRGKPPEGKWALAGYMAARAAVQAVCSAWVFGWFALALLALTAKFSRFMPDIVTQHQSGIVLSIVILGIVMPLWTILWSWYAVWLWRRERFTVTDDHYAETSRRLPFQNQRDADGAMIYLQSVTLTVTAVGWIFGYGHLTFKSWQDPEPIYERRFVPNPQRAKVILDMLANKNSKNGRTPLKA